MPAPPLLIYDAECAFCQRAVARWRERTGERVSYAPLQDRLLLRLLGISQARAQRALQLVERDGRRYEGASAVFRALRHAPGLRWLSLFGRLPLVRTVAEWMYRRVASHRTLAVKIDRLLFGRSTTAASTRQLRALFARALGGVSLIAFTSLRPQLLGLYGRRGVLPIEEFLRRARPALGRRRYRLLPTIFWIDASDRSLVRACELGQAAALAQMLGIAPKLSAALAWILYLSFVSVGRDFLGFQWDALLLESGFATLIGAPTPLMRWLVFRLHFESGLSKLKSRDPTWRGCTACAYHYETQPLPTPLGWYLHQLPRRAQQLSTLITLVVECAGPLLAFSPRRPRRLAFAVLTTLQALIAATGNYGFFNVLTVVLGSWLLDDESLARAIPVRSPPPLRRSLWRRLAPLIAALPLVAISATVLLKRLDLVRALPPVVVRAHDLLARLRILNRYGLFAVMTTRRREIIVEGSDDGVTWRAYRFRYKPGDPRQPPRFVAPHQPRLDWQMWFAALGPPPAWFERFLVRLLEGSPEVLRLLASNPFATRPPLLVRALLYDYEMTDRATRKRTGQWWRRELLGVYFPPCLLPAVDLDVG
jgi:predicted DCC family thiol-disulfide oxidoreductase YuxK